MAALLPIEVDGMTASLSHLDGVEIQVESGREVVLSLTNYTGFLTLTPSSRKNDMQMQGARGTKRRVHETKQEDPAAVNTVKKQKGQHVGGETHEESADNEDETCLSHVYAKISEAAGEQLSVDGGAEADKGIFALLGNGKNPAKTGAVLVSASGYDPGLRRPEDVTSGRKSGDGCMALPTGDVRGTSPQKNKEVCYFEFELKGGLEMKPTRYAMRNGSKDYGTYPSNWVLQQHDKDGRWVTISTADDDERLDGNRQMLCFFDITDDQGFSSRFRIRSTSAHSDRHPLWLLSVEFYGLVRRRKGPAYREDAQDTEREDGKEGGVGTSVSSANTSPCRVTRGVAFGGEDIQAAALSLTTIPSSVSCSPVVSPVKSRATGADKANVEEAQPAKTRHSSAGVKQTQHGSAGTAGNSRGGSTSASKHRVEDGGLASTGVGQKAGASKQPSRPPLTKGIASFFQKKV